MTAFVRDFRALGTRLHTWRVRPSWYAIALLTAPAMVLVAALPPSAVSPNYVPSLFTAENWSILLLTGLISGLAAGLFEEVGWTGFAVPRLLSRLGIFKTGLIVGLFWGLWHFIAAYWGAGTPDGHLSQLILEAGICMGIVAIAAILGAFRVAPPKAPSGRESNAITMG